MLHYRVSEEDVHYVERYLGQSWDDKPKFGPAWIIHDESTSWLKSDMMEWIKQHASESELGNKLRSVRHQFNEADRFIKDPLGSFDLEEGSGSPGQ